MKPEKGTLLSKLAVVGYATRLSRHMVPTIVLPIFARLDRPDEVLFPPFEIKGDRVIGGTWDTRRKLEQRNKDEEVTTLSRGIYKAEPECTLWIDEEMRYHYDPTIRANAYLERAAMAGVERAKDFLQEGRYGLACEHADRAISATGDPRAFELKARAYEAQGKRTVAMVLRELAQAQSKKEEIA